MKRNCTPTFLFRSRENGVPKPSKENWPSGMELPTLDSDIIKISILSLIISAKESNLFWIKLIFRCTKISLLRFSLLIVFRLGFVSDFAFARVSGKQSLTVTKSCGKKDQFGLFIWCNKVFAKTLFPLLFKWSFLLPKWNSLTASNILINWTTYIEHQPMYWYTSGKQKKQILTQKKQTVLQNQKFSDWKTWLDHPFIDQCFLSETLAIHKTAEQ